MVLYVSWPADRSSVGLSGVSALFCESALAWELCQLVPDSSPASQASYLELLLTSVVP